MGINLTDLNPRISMGGQEAYAVAANKYGIEFADAVVERELQLHADNLNCFEEYAGYDEFKEFINA